jgi:hypothetical protein
MRIVTLRTVKMDRSCQRLTREWEVGEKELEVEKFP